MRALSTRGILYAVLSGVMLTASFPPGKLDWLVWFALVPLLKGLNNQHPSQAFRLGFIAGFAHYLTLIYWIIEALKHYGGLNFPISLGILFLLCSYLSLYPALFSCLVGYLKGSRLVLFMMASLWVAFEYIKTKLLTGFPWCLLGYTQFRHLDLIQIADVVGVYGLSFLIVLSNGLIYALFFDRRLSKSRFLKWEVMMILLMATCSLVYGHFRLTGEKTEREGQKSITISIIQGNVDQSVKWNPAYQQKTLDKYHRLTHRASRFRPQLVVWPETAVPFFFQDNTKFSRRVFEISEASDADLIFGSPAYKRQQNRTTYYNRAYFLSPNGELSGYYDKVHLVPFGEYVPFKRFLPFVHRLVPAAGDFAPGEKIEPLKLSNVSAGVMICFEVIFPELARTQTKGGADIFVNLTNDAWFGMTSAPHQHLCMAVFRAVENGRPMIRAANTGFSAFINAHGKIISQGSLFGEEILEHQIKLDTSSLSFYTRHGHLFAFAVFIISLIKIFHALCYNKFIKTKEADNVSRSHRKN